MACLIRTLVQLGFARSGNTYNPLRRVFYYINNRIYYRKPRSEMGVTCVGRQKMKLGSKPLI